MKHLDAAAAGRSSRAVLQAVADHALAEATSGGYVAAEAAGPTITALRSGLADLCGVDAAGIALVSGAERALDALLLVAPLTRGDEVLVAPTEWGPNLFAFTNAGLRTRIAEVDSTGAFDLDALDHLLATDPPAVVHVTQQASHRAVRQPAAAIVERCRRVGVVVWVDAAQAAGHCDIASGADAVYATSRKWLTGPRGVGVLAVAAEYRSRLRLHRVRPPKAGAGPLDGVESAEAHVGGRVGLAVALAELAAAGLDRVANRLDEVGRATRERLADVPGWRVVDRTDAPGAITAIEPTDGQDVFEVRRRLIDEHRIVTTPCATARAPLDMGRPSLRVSPHVDVENEQLDALAATLTVLR